MLLVRSSDPGSDLITNLSALSGNSYYAADNPGSGKSVYSDRSYVYGAVPSFLQGATFVRTANDDKLTDGSRMLSFDLSERASIYIAHDVRYEVKPGWLSAFMDTGILINVDMGGNVEFRIYKKDYPAGKVHTGGNVNPAEPEDNSMYMIMAVPRDEFLDPPENLRVKD